MPNASLQGSVRPSPPLAGLPVSSSLPAGNTWSGSAVEAPPFIVAHILRSCRRAIIASSLTMIGMPAVALLFWRQFLDSDFATGKMVLLMAVIFIGGPIWAAVTLIKNLKWQLNVQRHPALTWPEIGGPEQVAGAIDVECALREHHERIGTILLTPNWLLSLTPFGAQSVPLTAIVWTHIHVTKQRNSSHKSYALHIFTRDKRQFIFAVQNEAHAEAFIRSVARRTPWAAIGFDKSTQQVWKQAPQTLVDQVDARRAAILDQASGSANAADVPEAAEDDLR